MDAAYTYAAFLSYSSKDAKAAADLHRRLERYPIPKKLARTTGKTRVGRIFRDRTDYKAGSPLQTETPDKVRASRALIVICSTDAAKSFWVGEEIRNYKLTHRPGIIIPVIPAHTPIAADPETLFPPLLRFVLNDAGEITDQREDLLAADLREGRDGRTSGLLKILATLLDVELNDLRNRELEAEAQRRRRALMLASSMGFLAVAALLAAGFALYESDRRQAFLRATQDAAVDYVLQAETLRLERSVPLSAMAPIYQITDRFMHVAEAEDPNGAVTLNLKAELAAERCAAATEQKDFGPAQTACRNAVADARRATARAPNDLRALKTLRVALSAERTLLILTGDVKAAEATFAELRAVEKTITKDDGSADITRRLEDDERQADAALIEGRYADAIAPLSSALALLEKNLELSGDDDADALAFHARLLNKMARARIGTNAPALALDAANHAVADTEKLLKISASQGRALEQHAYALDWLVQANVEVGELAAARTAADRLSDVTQKLVALDRNGVSETLRYSALVRSAAVWDAEKRPQEALQDRLNAEAALRDPLQASDISLIDYRAFNLDSILNNPLASKKKRQEIAEQAYLGAAALLASQKVSKGIFDSLAGLAETLARSPSDDLDPASAAWTPIKAIAGSATPAKLEDGVDRFWAFRSATIDIIRNALGPDQALPLYEKAINDIEKIAADRRLNPDDVSHAEGVVLERTCQSELMLARLDDAARVCERRLKIAEARAKASPDDLDAQTERVIAESKIMTVCMAKDDQACARAHALSGWAATEEILGAKPIEAAAGEAWTLFRGMPTLACGFGSAEDKKAVRSEALFVFDAMKRAKTDGAALDDAAEAVRKACR